LQKGVIFALWQIGLTSYWACGMMGMWRRGDRWTGSMSGWLITNPILGRLMAYEQI
jgi:hypothetical protein